MPRRPDPGSSESWRGDERYAYTDGRRLSRDESWLRNKAPGEKWPRFCGEIPPELAEEIDRQIRLVSSSFTRADAVRSALRLWLNAHDPEQPPAIDVEAVEMTDLPALMEEAPE